MENRRYTPTEIITLARARSCGACFLNPEVIVYAEGNDPGTCQAPQPYSRTEVVPGRGQSHLYTDSGVRCPTYQDPTGHIEYNL